MGAYSRPGGGLSKIANIEFAHGPYLCIIKMKVQPKLFPMRTDTYSRVEALVAKYTNLVAQTAEYKAAEQHWSDGPFGIPTSTCFMHVAKSLLARVYSLVAGPNADREVLEEYEWADYIEGLLSAEEEAFLVSHFDELADKVIDEEAEQVIATFGTSTAVPREWSTLVPHLIGGDDCHKVFLPQSDFGHELNRLQVEQLVTGSTDAFLRGTSLGLEVERYADKKTDAPFWSDVADGAFDAACVEANRDSAQSVCELFDATCRIVREGGTVLFCIPRDLLLNEVSLPIRRRLRDEQMLQAAIALPSGNVLLCVVKAAQDTFVMVDAGKLGRYVASEYGLQVVDTDRFVNILKVADQPEYDDQPFARRYPYDVLCEAILMPGYYLPLPEDGVAMGELVAKVTDRVTTDDCAAGERVVTMNNLAKTYTKSEIDVEKLHPIDKARFRTYRRVSTPCVIFTATPDGIAVGYVKTAQPLLVSGDLYVVTPREGTTAAYLAYALLSPAITRTLTQLTYALEGSIYRLTSGWEQLVKLPRRSLREQEALVAKAVLAELADTEKSALAAARRYKRAIHLRKHALSQNISAFSSLFGSLVFRFEDNGAKLSGSEKLSSFTDLTVAETFSILQKELQEICTRVDSLAHEQEWAQYGPCETLEPQSFIEAYEQAHRNADFRFFHLWEGWETNRYAEDVRDKAKGKLLFREGEPVKAGWFPPKALQQVFDNIVANARAHGFTDPQRDDYCLRFRWHTNGHQMVIEVSNNGAPIPSDMDTDLLLEYGYSSALNHDGHGGLGGGEIADIMRHYGGDVRIVSTPDDQFTVTYVLSLPLASLY